MEVPIPLQVPKLVAPCQDSFGKALQEKMGVYTKTSKQSWLLRVQLHPHSFPTSQHLASGFGDQHVAGVGWTGLMGQVLIAAPGLSASA